MASFIEGRYVICFTGHCTGTVECQSVAHMLNQLGDMFPNEGDETLALLTNPEYWEKGQDTDEPFHTMRYVLVAETDAGHAMLCSPQPDDFIPILPDARQMTNQGFAMAGIPLVMTNLHVRAAYRGQGMGSQMVEACQRFAARRGLPIVLRAHPYGRAKPMKLKDLIAFYERCGFTYVGEHARNAYLVWEPEA
jgi:ribosomal protein S18 acetylase RimI-like enzyme